jgi:hypothetical protein
MPSGFTTGAPISPPKTGYAGKGVQFLTGVAVDPAANVWAANNIDLRDEVCLTKVPDETLSTRCGGNASSCSSAWQNPCGRRWSAARYNAGKLFCDTAP